MQSVRHIKPNNTQDNRHILLLYQRYCLWVIPSSAVTGRLSNYNLGAVQDVLRTSVEEVQSINHLSAWLDLKPLALSASPQPITITKSFWMSEPLNSVLTARTARDGSRLLLTCAVEGGTATLHGLAPSPAPSTQRETQSLESLPTTDSFLPSSYYNPNWC